jgi:hypothetical protein
MAEFDPRPRRDEDPRAADWLLDFVADVDNLERSALSRIGRALLAAPADPVEADFPDPLI